MSRLPEVPEEYATFDFDDESIPTFIRRNEAMRMMLVALREAKGRGITAASSEAAYYSAKAAETMELLEAGNSATSTNNMIKGQERTNAALEKWRAEQIGYENAKDAHQAYKAIMKILNDDIQRDWEQEKRTT